MMATPLALAAPTLIGVPPAASSPNALPVITATQVIERPIEEVFSTIADAARFHERNPTITRARQLTDGEPRVGSRFERKLRGFGTVVQEFGEFERNKRIRIVPQMRGLGGGHRFTFTKQGNLT
jgi:uncharacterized protein YndB with AHSA1/START domain